MILCRKEFALSAKETQQLENTSETALIALGHYSMQQINAVASPPPAPAMLFGFQSLRRTTTPRESPTPEPSPPNSSSSTSRSGGSLVSTFLPFSCYRFGKLLLGLRGLSMHCYEASVRAMFREVAGDGLMEHFVTKL
ncbi:uncharacterized protein LOC131681506 [Topomyia yanbarensis]|uniref:uncharacterized protein LOC131681506 n=1 Tax=Topomyia yanbarensis TaxID=2498891 RepID=UPI00273C51F5|nr:uncharacterized protein LOC131681506 [Topomyia yanbarensis]